MAAGGQVVALTADVWGWGGIQAVAKSSSMVRGRGGGQSGYSRNSRARRGGGGGDGGQAVAHRGKKEKNKPLYGSVVS